MIIGFDAIKISVITWDGGFREKFHILDSFVEQTIEDDKFEFLWVNYYDNVSEELYKKVERIKNGEIICLNKKGTWHIGECLNEGIRQSHGDIIVFPDGDVVVASDFLENSIEMHKKIENLVLYYHRWDEIEHDHTGDVSLSHLKHACKLTHATNYGGCLSTTRWCLDFVKGYEEHPVFAGAGAISSELHTRFKNAGFPIMWHPTKRIYHPWHPGSGGENASLRRVNWQRTIIKQRAVNLVSKSYIGLNETINESSKPILTIGVDPDAKGNQFIEYIKRKISKIIRRLIGILNKILKKFEY